MTRGGEDDYDTDVETNNVVEDNHTPLRKYYQGLRKYNRQQRRLARNITRNIITGRRISEPEYNNEETTVNTMSRRSLRKGFRSQRLQNLDQIRESFPTRGYKYYKFHYIVNKYAKTK